MEVSEKVFMRMQERLKKFGEDWKDDRRVDQKGDETMALITPETAEEFRVAYVQVAYVVLDD